MTEEEIFDRMDDYLMGRLVPEEVKAFEADLARHPEWQEEFELRRIEHEGMDLLVEDKLRAAMSRWDEEKNAPKKNSGRWYIIAMVLSIAALSVVFFLKKGANTTLLPSSKPSLDSLKNDAQPIDNQTLPTGKQDLPVANSDEKIQSPDSPTPNAQRQPASALAEKSVGDLDMSLGTRGDEDEKTLALADSLDAALVAKDYRRLLQLTEQPVGAQAATLQYIRGWAYFKLGNFAGAEKIFEKLVAENNARLYVKSQRMLMYSLLAQFPKQEKALEKLLDGVLGAASHPLKTEAEAVKRAIQ
ncbi:MAG: hypothetical protein IPN76_34110 [Saprospiraceae bacterium]|nr:hypothetical protein [Saprospiraceae bacterium]